MSLLTTLVRLRDRRRLEQIAQELAENVRRPLFDHVIGATIDLPRAEARGYVRAASRALVEARVALFVHDHPTFPGELRGEFVAAVREHVVEMVTSELGRRILLPPVRRAA